MSSPSREIILLTATKERSISLSITATIAKEVYWIKKKVQPLKNQAPKHHGKKGK
jgi:hypothetical protein